MLACFLEVTRKVAVRDVPVPKLAPGDILARMEASGICGTDLEKIEGQLGPCGFAEYFRVPQYNVAQGAAIPLPPELSFEEGAMIEPTACCIRAIRRAHVQKSENVLVVGLGPTGLTQIQLLRNTTTGRII